MMPRFLRVTLIALATVVRPAHAQDEHTTVSSYDENPGWVSAATPDWREPVDEKIAPAAPVLAAAGSPITPSAHQPVGALSGRVVFMNSGHGWTWNTSGFWYLQRPTALNAMNEDYGNLDQLNCFATYCFNAGAIVASMRPLGQQTNEVVLDNISPAVTYAGSWNNSISTVYFGKPGDVPYRVASLDTTETATATYTPTIPVAGYYPVYTWVRHGSDRGDQLYRIRHTGGETQYRVPHYMVGNGWIYLGEYFFNAGSNAASGAVVISNLRASTNGSVVIADAIRFGNGMGSVNRGGGVSGYPREEESCRYWIQANLGQGQSTNLYETGGTDEQDSWSAPGRMSAEMNREQYGSMYQRIHLSFHSNAGGQRGTEGLITSVPTPNQTRLAQLCGSSVNDELVGLGSPPLEFPWFNRGTNITFSGAYGEISNNNFVNEMDATIIEVAYHDNATDASLLRDSKVRAAVGRAALHGVIRYMNQFDTTDPVPLIFPPEPPANVRAFGNAGGAITLAWTPPTSVAGSGTPTNYVIYQSTNGYGFGNAISVGTLTNFTLTNLAPGADNYFRIAAANAGGESLPSEVVGCRVPASAGSKKILYVNAFDRFDRTTNLKQDLAAQNYIPPNGSGANERVLPRRVNAFDYVVPHGRAISAFGAAFDTCQNEAVTGGLVALTNYAVVIWACGNESTADETFSSAEQSQVAAFLAGGGNLFVSGSEIAWDLDRPSGPTTADRNFLHNQLHATFAADSSGVWNFNAAGGSIFSNNAAGLFDDGSRGIYLVGFPDVLTPTGTGAVGALSYTGVVSGAAGVVYDGSVGGGKVVYLGFPFETITSASVRNEYLADVLNFFGVNSAGNKPVIVTQPADQTVTAGGTAAFTVLATSTTPLGYQWRFNGTPAAAGDTNTLQLVNVQAGQSGDYDVVITNVAGAVTSSVAKLTVKTFSTVEAWGYNDFGQTAPMPGLTNLAAIAAGGYHNLALSKNGGVFAWGNNLNGQCDVPANLTNVAAIGAGSYHSLAVSADGRVWAWGANDAGQTLVPASATNIVAVAGGGSCSLALRADGQMIAWGDNSWGQTNIPAGASNIVAVAVGGHHCLALKYDGTVIAWGNDLGPYGSYAGQTAVPVNLNQVVAVAGGGFHSLAVKADGTVATWGDNSAGQLALPSSLTNATAVAAGLAHSLALRADGTVVAWGDDLYGQSSVDPDLAGVLAVAAGDYHSLVLRGSPTAASWLINPLRNSNGFSVSVPTLRGKACFLEFKNSLADAQWTVLNAAPGDGSLKTFTDASAGPTQRFYRVRQQ